jgi:hypothetical protein
MAICRKKIMQASRRIKERQETSCTQQHHKYTQKHTSTKACYQIFAETFNALPI